MLENHKKTLSNQQHSSLKIKHFNKQSHYLLLSIIICSIIKIFIMIQSSVNTQINFSESNQSLDSVIYFKLSSHLSKFLRTNFIWKHHQFMSHFQTFNESLKYQKCKAVTTLSWTRLRSFSRRFKQSSNSTRSRCRSLWAI